MKKWVVLVLGISFVSVGSLSAKEVKFQPYAFSLEPYMGEATVSHSPGIFFSLATPAIAPAAAAGAGIIEDDGPPYNTALGWLALEIRVSTSYTTAIGYEALNNDTSGEGNTAVGCRAMLLNTIGKYNTATGYTALQANTEGNSNTASGQMALGSNSHGSSNVAIGVHALGSNTTGNNNTGVGVMALYENLTGEGNVALGYNAGQYGTGNYNIIIGADVQSVDNESNTIRIGHAYMASNQPPLGQNQTFIAGIVETPMTVEMSPAVVGITSEGRLGTMSSDLLPPGPQGPPGPAGEGLISGSVLILPTDIAPPAGYNFLGSTTFNLTKPDRKVVRVTFNVYQKQ